MSVILETTIGDLVVDLFTEERPRACLNFLKLCKVKYYNYNLFHSVQRNFLAQSGDPTGSGRGGEAVFRSLYGDQAKFFEAEIKPRIKHVKKGTVSMVNNGNDMHGSQFFITLGENLDYLDGQHTVFGEVAEGFEILDKLNEAICDDSHRPYQDIRITHTVVLDDPYDDPEGLKVPDRSPEPTKEQLDSGRIGADEEIDDAKGKTQEEVEEMIGERELNAGTQILEMVGDIPDADVKPPENVLFVCKLNPVTTDEDLEIIFSRFGAIKCCEIIKDSLSQESLQYAFIEYENVEDCERAYFKMDNVLIDDRRVHVDFSQSVAKLVHNKPGSKPVYELKDNKETKLKLKIKDKSKKEKYDLVFDENDSDGGKRSTPGKRSKEKKDYKKRRRTSTSDERSPENRKHKDVDVKSGGNHHGNLKRDSYEDEEERLQHSASERRGKERDTRGDKRDKRHTKRDKDDRAEKQRRDRDSDEGEIRGKLGHSGKRGDRGSEDRYRRNDRDITRDKGKRGNSEEKYSKDSRGYSRNEKGLKEKTKKTKEGSLERNRKQRQDSPEPPYSGDKRGYHRKTKTAKDSEASDDASSSEDENRRSKRRKDGKRHDDEKKKRKYRQHSESDS